ncbi:hypothetical protein G1K66_08540 [Tenacibaculum finnmarkense]|uniref:hypothetical protein n=1 Tax=Tenacibaculum finnmarkense TaxID=2781243 RepID=UPI001EFA5CA4|nr:hypothetical protein [Tenacibaculum finnmarkense]MCG8813308.1 hypothetical protein [Tenacibaculum finnmarkense]
MAFTKEINTGIEPNDRKGAGLRTNMRILIANDVYLRELLRWSIDNLESLKTGYNTHNHDDRYYRIYQIDGFINAKLGVNETAKNALNAGKLGNHPPEYYANSATTYSKTDVDNAILTSMNEVVQILLNNPDVEINSIQELLSEMTTADNALVASIANKVSYVVFQNVSLEQQKIAQKNIGLLNHTHEYIRSQELLNESTGELLSTEGILKGVSLQTNTFGSTGFPNIKGASVHFFYGNTPGLDGSLLRNFTFWKGINADDLYIQVYGVDGGSKGFKKIFTEANLSKSDIDILGINAKTLEGKSADNFALKQQVLNQQQVATYTAKAPDVGNIVQLYSNLSTEIILNTASFPLIGDKAQYFYKGTGTCKISTSGTARVLKNINDTLEFDGQYSMIEITKTGANEYFVCGQLIRA